jgi:hypothetical protein
MQQTCDRAGDRNCINDKPLHARQLPVNEDAKRVGCAECSGMTITSKSRYKKSSGQYIGTALRPAGAPVRRQTGVRAWERCGEDGPKKKRADIDMGQKNFAGKGPLWL